MTVLKYGSSDRRFIRKNKYKYRCNLKFLLKIIFDILPFKQTRGKNIAYVYVIYPEVWLTIEVRNYAKGSLDSEWGLNKALPLPKPARQKNAEKMDVLIAIRIHDNSDWVP